MIEEIRRLLAERPFAPFAILSSGGHRYEVPTADHAGFNPKGTRVVVWFDDGSSIILSGLHLVGVEMPKEPSVS